MSRTQALKDKMGSYVSGTKPPPMHSQAPAYSLPQSRPVSIVLPDPSKDSFSSASAASAEGQGLGGMKAMSTEEAARILAARLPARTEEGGSRVPPLKLPLRELDVDAGAERRPLSPMQAQSPPQTGFTAQGGNTQKLSPTRCILGAFHCSSNLPASVALCCCVYVWWEQH